MLQGFDLVNEGVGEVRDVEIRYGAYVFPPGGVSSIVRVAKIKGLGFHQAATVPIPDLADIHWRSADGHTHDVRVPIRGLISDMGAFQGFKFMFEDDHIELAATYLRKPPQQYGTYYVPVYSSQGHADSVSTGIGNVPAERPKP